MKLNEKMNSKTQTFHESTRERYLFLAKFQVLYLNIHNERFLHKRTGTFSETSHFYTV